MADEGQSPEADEPSDKPEASSAFTNFLLRRYRTTPDPRTRALDIAKRQEITASWLAYGLLFVFTATIGAVLLYAFVEDKDGAVDLATTILPYTGTPLALALGYYFGLAARR